MSQRAGSELRYRVGRDVAEVLGNEPTLDHAGNRLLERAGADCRVKVNRVLLSIRTRS